MNFLNTENEKNFLPPVQSLMATFRTNQFPAIFRGHLAFLNDCKNVFISDMVGDRAIFAKCLTPRLSAESTGDFST